MTIHAAIVKDDSGNIQVYQLKETRCPSCNARIGDLEASAVARIACSRCGAIWMIMEGKFKIVRHPQRLDGRMR